MANTGNEQGEETILRKSGRMLSHCPINIFICGDFINDYEGIGGYEQYRGELGLMYFLQMDPGSGMLAGLTMKPTRMKKFRVNRAAKGEAAWLRETLNREGRRFGTRVEPDKDNSLILRWE